MPKQKATITFSGDEKDLLKSFQRQEREMAKVQGRLKRMGKTGGRAAKQVGSGVKQATGQLQSFIGAVAGIGTVVGGVATAAAAIRQELEALQRRQELARVEQTTFAQQVRGVRKNFATDETLPDENLEDALRGVGERTRTDPKLVAAAASTAFSAKGQLSNRVALDAVEQAFRVSPGDAGEATQLASRSLDVAKATGQTDIKSIIGFLTNAQQASRVTTLKQLGQTAVPTISSLKKMGDSAEEAGELFASMSQLLADAEGNITKTATISFAEQLKSFVPKAEAKDERGKFGIPEAQREAFEAAKETQERIGVLQQSPELRRAFLAQASFEKQATAPIRALLEGQKSAVAELTKAQQTVKALNEQQAARFEGLIGRLEGGKFQAPLSLQQKTDEIFRGLDLANTRGARIDVVRGGFEDLFERVNFEGPDFVARSRIRSEFEARELAAQEPGGPVPELVAAGILSRESLRAVGQKPTAEDLREIRTTRKFQKALIGSALEQAVEDPREARAGIRTLKRQISQAQTQLTFARTTGAPEQRIEIREQNIQILKQSLALLQQIAEEQRRSREATESNTAETRKTREATEANTTETRRLRETQAAGNRNRAAAGALANQGEGGP